jgi:lysophospholipase L1-like esterase
MKSSRIAGSVIGITAVLTTILFASGFVYAFKQIILPPSLTATSTSVSPESTPGTASEGIRIVALGDSLTAGTGDLTGKGYVQRVREKLQTQTGRPVFIHNNLAIPGDLTDGLLQKLKQKTVLDAVKEANLILLTIGGNDINNGVLSPKTEQFDWRKGEANVAPALEKLNLILSAIHQANPNADVLFVGLYNPYLDKDKDKQGTAVLQKFNNGAFEIINSYKNMTFVPTYDLFERDGLKYLYSDHFHPNQDGYERIADRIVQILK